MIFRKTKKPSLPRAKTQDRATQQVIDALTESYEVGEGLRGNPLDRKLTLRDLTEIGLIKFKRMINTGAVEVDPAIPPFLPAIPPAPAGFAVTGAFATILLEWSNPHKAYANHARTEVYRADTDDFGQAVLIGSSTGSMYADAAGNSASFYYWIRFVSTSDVVGPINAAAGTHGQTADDPGYLMSVLAEEYGSESASPFFQLDEDTEINGTLVPAGTYMKSAFIHNAMIDSAQIKNVAADKILAGEIHAAIKMTAATIEGGTIEAGVLRSFDGKFVIDLTNKFISITV